MAATAPSSRLASPTAGSPLTPEADARTCDALLPVGVFEPTELGDADKLSRLEALADAAGHDYLQDYIEAQALIGDLPARFTAVCINELHLTVLSAQSLNLKPYNRDGFLQLHAPIRSEQPFADGRRKRRHP